MVDYTDSPEVLAGLMNYIGEGDANPKIYFQDLDDYKDYDPSTSKARFIAADPTTPLQKKNYAKLEEHTIKFNHMMTTELLAETPGLPLMQNYERKILDDILLNYCVDAPATPELHLHTTLYTCLSRKDYEYVCTEGALPGGREHYWPLNLFRHPVEALRLQRYLISTNKEKGPTENYKNSADY